MSTFIIIPAHNRKQYTLSCLQNLRAIGIMEHFRIVIIDDGSSDGTADSVSNQFPDVILLQGDGSLYWTGAIELGMRYAIEHGAECLVWLNDDSVVPSGAIERLVQIANETQGIASAQTFVDMHTIRSKYFFPAKYKGKWGIINKAVTSDKAIMSVDVCRGNLVAISRNVVEVIGYPDGANLPHALGDSDYSLRATESGILCSLVTDVLLEELGTIRSDNHSWLLGEIPIRKLWKDIFSKRSSLYMPMRWKFLTRHWGFKGALQYPLPYMKLAIITFIRIILPRQLLIALYGERSHAWKAKGWSRSISGDILQ